MDTASLFNDLATRLTDADAKAILREQIDAGIIADKGQEWFDANKAMLDADWENALAELGFTDTPEAKPASRP